MKNCILLLSGLVACCLSAAERPIGIDVGRQLFVDDFLIASTAGIVRVYNHPVKAFDAPLLFPETDLEREVAHQKAFGERLAPAAVATSGGLWWDARLRRFRLWYESGWMHRLSYAESEDGVRWTRPDCGVVPGTNALLPDLDLDSWSVVPDYAADDPYSNWRMMVSLAGGTTDNRLFASSDGWSWTHVGDGGKSGDRSTLYYDPFRGEWVFSLRAYDGGRSRRRFASKEFGGPTCRWNWPDGAEKWMAADARDIALSDGGRPSLYNFDAVAYESVMLGMAEILQPIKGDNGACVKAGLPKITDLHFAYSRDGRNFIRPDRTAAIPASRWGSGKWDTGYLSPMGGLCVIRDERLWFYYSGMRGDATETKLAKHGVDWRGNGMHFNGSIGVATLRRDGFAGLVADGRGEVVTKPLAFSGGHLFVNAECRFGALSAEVLEADGAVVPGFSAADCRTFARKDAVKAELRWKNADLSALAGRPVRLRFKLHCGTLYSFWVARDASGKSGGYVAAGGPAYPGLRDL